MAEIVPFRAGDWEDKLQISQNGTRKTNLYNACVVLRMHPALRGRVMYDEFKMQTIVAKPLPWSNEIDRPWTNFDDNAATEWIQAPGRDVNVGRETVQQAVETVAYESRFHPVRDWLTSLKWDGKPRVDGWLTYYLGVEPSPETSSAYIETVGRCWLVSAVARIMKPGCKADHVLVAEGRQGIKKSTAIRTLASIPWFTDELADFGSKDAGMQMRGVWIIELGEMDHMSKTEVTRIKAAVSRCVDRFRPPYGQRLVEAPRECVFVGTVNHKEYLKDETGNRRFWPVECKAIDIDALAEDREQLWAEAVALFKGGEDWWIIDPEVTKEAQAQQAERNESDPWLEVLRDWIREYGENFETSEALVRGIGKRKEDIREADSKRVRKCLEMMGYKRRSGLGSMRDKKTWRKVSD